MREKTLRPRPHGCGECNIDRPGLPLTTALAAAWTGFILIS